ncbi:Uncharacterised protein [Salmonella bongori]|nr:Uncharacterised protein [Salmonella bongori]
MPSPFQPYRILSDIPSLSRVVITVPIVIQPRFFILNLSRQTNELLQSLQINLIQRFSPFVIVFPSYSFTACTYQRQRQSAMVSVIQMDFSLRDIFRLHQVCHPLYRQPTLRQPRTAGFAEFPAL